MAKTSRLFNATLSAALVTDVDMKSFRRAKTITHYANKSNRHSWACDATRAADGRKDLSARCPLVTREVFTIFAKVVTELFMLCRRDAITVLGRSSRHLICAPPSCCRQWSDVAQTLPIRLEKCIKSDTVTVTCRLNITKAIGQRMLSSGYPDSGSKAKSMPSPSSEPAINMGVDIALYGPAANIVTSEIPP